MKRLVPVLVAVALVLAACQSATENLTEKLIEQSAGVDDVNIDTNSGELNIETDEGSISIGGGEIPDGFPIPLPDGGEVMSVFDAPQSTLVSLLYRGDRYDELVVYFDDWSSSQGGDWSRGTSSFDQGDGTMVRTANWFGDDMAITITDCIDPDSNGDAMNAVCVSAATGSGS